MIARYLIALVLGAVVTVGVLFTMQVLVAAPQAKLDEGGSRHFVDFVRVQRDETVKIKERRRKKPTVPDAPPPQAIPQRVDNMSEAQVAVSMPAAPVDMGMEMSVSGLGLATSDGEYLPIVKIEPVYPRVARSRGIEGYCLVEYTVTTTGTTKDIMVIEADPRGIFNSVSIAAAKKFKYRPRVVNGAAIEVQGVRNLFIFKLEK